MTMPRRSVAIDLRDRESHVDQDEVADLRVRLILEADLARDAAEADAAEAHPVMLLDLDHLTGNR